MRQLTPSPNSSPTFTLAPTGEELNHDSLLTHTCTSTLLRIGTLNVRGIKHNSTFVKKFLDTLACRRFGCRAMKRTIWITFTRTLTTSLWSHLQWRIVYTASPVAAEATGVSQSCGERHFRTPRSCSHYPAIFVLLFLWADSALALFIRSACTDPFREALDHIDVVLQKFPGRTFLLGDLNADPGSTLPSTISSTPMNEQGSILVKYLLKWDYSSVQLYLAQQFASVYKRSLL